MDLVDNIRKKGADGVKRREETCEHCDNTGWVDLAGSITVGGVEYPRGVAPCRWCREGVNRYTGHKSPDGHGPLESNYDASHLSAPPSMQGSRPITFDQYAETEAGKADPNLEAAKQLLVKR